MKIQIDRLTESPREHRFRATREWWSEPGRLDAAVADLIEAPLEFRVDAHRMGADVYLDGEVTGELRLACARCLQALAAPIADRFRLVLEPAGHRVPADPEGAAALARDGLCLADELESGWFRGSEIDLASFFQEVVALLLPVQPLCREECAGLCPRCGADRNAESCACKEEGRGSPFAVLAALRDRLTQGGTR